MSHNYYWKDLGLVTLEEEPSKFVTVNCDKCKSIMEEPYQAMCDDCDYSKYFCSNCIKNKDNHKCSTNRYRSSLKEKSFRDKNLEKIINNDLKVYCVNKEKGCSWVGSLSKLTEHVNRKEKDRAETTRYHRCCNHCCYEELPCIHKGCRKKIKRHDLKEHEMKECEFRPYYCPHDCGTKGTYKYTTSADHLGVCKKLKVNCKNDCKCQLIPRDELQAHYDTNCTKQPVDCPFDWAGCTARPLRGDLPHHVFDWQHMLLLADKCGDLKKANEKLKKEYQDMQAKFYKAVHGDVNIIMPGKPIKVWSTPERVVFFTEEYGCKMAVFYGKIPVSHKVAEMTHGKIPFRDENIEFIIYGQFKISDKLKITITTATGRDIILNRTTLIDAPPQSPIETKRLTAKVEHCEYILIKRVEGMDKCTTWQCF